LKGQGSLGNSYVLQGATFTITGPVNQSLSGDTDTVTDSLPVGQYTVKLENGWTLKKAADAGNAAVSAVLASANPQTFVINGSQTTSIMWMFNVSGATAGDDDAEIVAVSNGTANFTLTSGEEGWANFASGGVHTCAISKTGQLKCWGSNISGQLGYGDVTDRLAPAATAINVGVGRTVKRVVASVANNHTCALLDDATVKCWGNNSFGQLGYADSVTRNSPPDPVVNLGSSNTAKSIAVGSGFTCIILDTNGVKCWGLNSSGQLGYGDTTSRSAPAATTIVLGPGTAAKEVVAGSAHACALLADNTVTCWGANSVGQLGNCTNNNSLSPTSPINLGSGRTAKRLAAGSNHTCAILDNDALKCWGTNSFGELGYGDTTSRSAPDAATVNLGVGRTAKLVTAGTDHTCALLDDNTVKCWGGNSSGQLGYEDTNQRSAPPALAVNLGTGRVARRLLASTQHTCVILNDNGIKCWGANASGLFGLGTSGETRGDQLNEMGDFLPEVLP
jgi:alpha-tubulin suppressor-like RCC1 family protein